MSNTLQTSVTMQESVHYHGIVFSKLLHSNGRLQQLVEHKSMVMHRCKNRGTDGYDLSYLVPFKVT
jgi:hypothetical protein